VTTAARPKTFSSSNGRLARPGGAARGVRIARIVRLAAVLVAALTLHAHAAEALSFRADFVRSTYQTQVGDTYADLLLAHQSGTPIQSTVTTGLAGISTSIYGGGVNNNYSILLTTSFEVSVAGSYTFQVGTDWGRGGAAALIDTTTGSVLSERVITDDVWWNFDWNNPDVFTTTSTFSVGDRATLVWVGFEGCCGGSSTIRFSVDGGAYQSLNQANFASYTVIPEPSVALLVGLGLTGLGVGRRVPRRASV
jgi:hypothetical protein